MVRQTADFDILKRHAICLQAGRFSSCTEDDVANIFREHIPEWIRNSRRVPGLLFWAHGGLVPHAQALETTLRRIPFWLTNGIYPVFFIWETGVRETISNLMERSRIPNPYWRWLSRFSDRAIEAGTRSAGMPLWNGIKESAAAPCSSGGGAQLVAQETASLLQRFPRLTVHAAAPSAGSIFQAHFLPALLEAGVPFLNTLHLLAPAVDIDLFKRNLLPLAGTGVYRTVVYALTSESERTDAASPYRKSLLHLVSRAFETPGNSPLLGLAEHLQKDAKMSRLFIDSTKESAKLASFGQTCCELVLAPSVRCAAGGHSEFEDDPVTLRNIADDIRACTESKACAA